MQCNMKKQKITQQDYLKAHRKASREEEITQHGRPARLRAVHKSKKTYDRKREKAGLRNLPFPFCPGTESLYRRPYSPALQSRTIERTCSP